MDDVLGQFVVTGRDPHLVSEEPVGAVLLGLGAGGDVGQGTTGLRFGQAHGAGETPLDHGAHEGVDLFLSAVLQDQGGIARGQGRVGRSTQVRGLEPGGARRGDHARDLRAAHGLGHTEGGQAGLGVDLQRLFHLGDDVDAFTVEVRFLGVARLVVWGEVVGGHAFGQFQGAVEGFA